MKTTLIAFSLLALASSGLCSEPKTEILDAIRKLAGSSGYSWVSTPKTEGSESARRLGAIEGKTQSDGYTYLKGASGETTVEIALKGEKMAVNYNGDWLSTAEIGENNSTIRRLRALKPPAQEAEALTGKAAELKKESDGVYSGEMKPDAAKELFALLGRRAAEAPEAKGTMKFWIKDGALAKYDFAVRGKITVGGEEKREVEISRTTTVEIKNVGSTTVSLPEDAKKKL
jgi:hypothetical protein